MSPRRLAGMLVLVAAFGQGCSTHPLVDFCDYWKPGHLYPTEKGLTPYGGVAVQAGTIPGTAPSTPFVPVVPPAVPVFPGGSPVMVPTIPPPPGGPAGGAPSGPLPPVNFPG